MYAVAAGAANLLGAAAVTSRRRWSPAALDAMLALAAGFMMSASVTDMLPEAIEAGGRSAAVVALVGYLLVHLTQHSLAPHFHFGEETHEVSASVGASALVGLMLHTLVDGVAIATPSTSVCSMRPISADRLTEALTSCVSSPKWKCGASVCCVRCTSR